MINRILEICIAYENIPISGIQIIENKRPEKS
jgi:hypothetical protein